MNRANTTPSRGRRARGKPPNATAPKPTARGAALAVLGQVLGRKRPLDQVLADPGHNGGLDGLDPRDRGFARTLVATVLRRRGQIDRVLAACVARPVPINHGRINDILRLGAAQILFLDTPPHAAVDSTVALVPRRSGSFRGLVNAVLRRLARERADWVAEGDGGARANTPDWLWRSWSSAYGAATARAIAAVHLETPPLDFTVKYPGRAEALARALDAQVLPTGSLRRRTGGVVSDLPGYSAGEWWVQDTAATLPVRLLLTTARVRGWTLADLAAIDLCAAPGGKTAQLAAAGVRVTAVDRSANRLARLERNFARLGLNVDTVVGDGATWHPPAPVDLVLLDAPCSATGTLRRRPDIPHLKSADDIAALVDAQTGLLRAAARMVSARGILVYAVCSLEPEEGPGVVAEFIAANPDFARVPITAAEIGGLAPCVTPDGDLRTLPCHLGEQGGMDGFYAARLTRTEQNG